MSALDGWETARLARSLSSNDRSRYAFESYQGDSLGAESKSPACREHIVLRQHLDQTEHIVLR